MAGPTYLRGTPAFECTLEDNTDTAPQGELSVDCTTPGEIDILGVSEGIVTLTVATGGAETNIEIQVTPH